MTPIMLTRFGEVLRSEQAEEDELSCCIGVHHICKGFIDIRDISITHKVIICRGCALRIVIPVSVKTYKDLRKELKKYDIRR